MHPSPVATSTVRGWTRAALEVEVGAEPVPVGPASTGTPDLLAAVTRHRLAEVLARHASALRLPPDVTDALDARLTTDRRAHAVRVLEVAQVGRALEGAGVRWLLVKGPALAAQTTGDPRARGTGDLDVFVAPDDVQAALGALQAAGWTPRARVPAAGSWAMRHVMDAEYEIALERPASTVDLHWRLDPTHGGLPAFEVAWAQRVAVDVGGTEVDTLSPVHALTHTCHHAAKDQWRWLRSIVDVHRLARLPEAWAGPAPGTVDLQTLAVTSGTFGLPPTVPGPVVREVSGVPARVGRRAAVAQDRPVWPDRTVPGAYVLAMARYRVTASPAPADVRRTLRAAVAPQNSVIHLDDRSRWTAVPRLLAQRVVWLLRRVANRLRGQADTALHEPQGRT